VTSSLPSGGRRRALRAASALSLAALCFGALAACRDEVPLGSWLEGGRDGGAGDAGAINGSGGVPGGEGGASAGAGGDGGATASLPECLAPGTPGAINVAGTEPGSTETSTEWTLSDRVESLEWDLVVERDVIETEPASTGYYYHQRFFFDRGIVGIFGIQAEGIYQSEPPASDVDITKIAVFWLSGPPLEAQLGDIPYPDARVAPTTANGVNWLTIHARFPWEVCHVYRFRVAPESTDPSGNVWYGAWIDDTTTGDSTLIGRMLISAESGLISTLTISRVSPFVYDARTCAVPSPTSALFGAPRGNGGSVGASLSANRFESPARCATSRFTSFEGAVRHQIGPMP
jgi:hypothetical protein